MKRFLCVLLCLLLAAPAALADDYTPTQLFRQQFIVGGNGLRGTVTISASGVAEWLEPLLPFTSQLQVRVIGEKQAGMSELVDDDEDWQMKLWAKDAAGDQRALTYIYGSPEGLYIRSDLLPDTLLTLPVQNVNLPYQLADGELLGLFMSFDLLGLTAADNGGNTTAWSALADVAAIPPEDWEADWSPVLSKYDTLMDMWLSAYASPTVISGGTGSMTLRTTYEIPVEDVKEQTKYIIGLMLSDSDLQSLLAPYLTDEQRSLYLNPAMYWFYEHCIDIVPLNGSILLEREMTAMGETTSMTISLPLPTLPQELTTPLGELAADVFSLPYRNAFDGLENISIRQSDGEMSVSLNSPERTVTLILADRAEEGEDVHWEGFFRITPAVGVEEPLLSAAFTWRSSQSLWEDEDYNTHEDFGWSLEISPDLTAASPDDPFRSTYVEFMPVSLSASVGYTKKDKANSPVQLSIELSATLPGADVGLSASLKVAERWEHEALPTTGGESLITMAPERREALRTLFVTNAIDAMSTLNDAPAETPAQ